MEDNSEPDYEPTTDQEEAPEGEAPEGEAPEIEAPEGEEPEVTFHKFALPTMCVNTREHT